MMKGPPSGAGDSESHLFDASVVAMALLAISSASLEGLGPAFTSLDHALTGSGSALRHYLHQAAGAVSDLASIKFGVEEIAGQTTDHRTAAALLGLIAGGLTGPRTATSDEDIHSIASGLLLDSINQNDNNTC
jgi:hypothetical protein